MKRIVLLVLILGAAGLLAWGIHRRFAREAQAKREAAYQARLLSLTRVLKSGMTRKQVEDYLREKNITYMQECCVVAQESGNRHTLDDLAKIGQEDHPWFCSENNVYLAFRFSDYGKPDSNWQIKDNELDALKSITIYHQLEGCL